MKNFFSKWQVLLLCVFFFGIYVSCNKTNESILIGSYAKITDGDSVVIDTTVIFDDTGGVYSDTLEIDSICFVQNFSFKTFNLYAKFGTFPAPGFVWVMIGSTWYGPIPISSVQFPNTYIYNSAWFDQILANMQIGLGCVKVKFTYNTSFYSSSNTITVCPCTGGGIGQ